MSSRNLVEAECGAPNAVVRLAQHVTTDQAFKQESLPVLDGQRHAFINDYTAPFREENLVEEFLLQEQGTLSCVPQTFHMGKLMHEMQIIEQDSKLPPGNGNIKADTWATEFTQNTTPEWPWAREFLNFQENIPSIQNIDKQNQESQIDSLQWVDESLSMTAAQLLDQVDDKEFSYSQFMKFVEKIKNKDVVVNEGDQTAAEWAHDFQSGDAEGSDEASAWSSEINGSQIEDIPADGRDFWDQLQQEWEKLAKDDHLGEHPWLSDFRDVSNQLHEYKFEEDNPVKDHPSPFEAGLEKLKEGNLPSAIMFFEAAVQRDSEHMEAWQYLGTTHAENEQDPLAIAALKRCLDLDPSNLTAWMAIAVSYTNESYQEQACHALSSWIAAHPRYNNLSASANSMSANTNVTSIMNKKLYQHIMNMYLAAAQLNSSEPDPDIQCGLGVLLNLSGDYDKAVDCFRTALVIRPNDALLWNRLGATLANSSRSEEAIDAYYRALEIAPGFIRSRYNLGISCNSLGAHREAIEHFLSALNSQACGSAGLLKNSSAVSENIWSTMRMVLSLMNRYDLHAAVDSRDLQRLNQEFPCESSSAP